VKLSRLLQKCNIIRTNVNLNIEINSLHYDSRKIGEGDVFVAIEGYKTDGHNYISGALEKGAVAIICSKMPDENIPYVLVDDTRKALSLMSAEYFGNPCEKLKIIGVTGTNGKTTSTYLIKKILEEAKGEKVGLIGTMEILIGDSSVESDRTTPESYELQRIFKQMVDENCTYAVMEISSHALALDRVYGVKFKTGVFTNLTQDHLDFHNTMEEYLKAKAKLFEICDVGVINKDDEAYEYISKVATSKLYTYGINNAADMMANDISLGVNSIDFVVRDEKEEADVHVNIPGKFTVYNTLDAILTCKLQGISLDKIAHALRSIVGVKGRVESVETNRNFTVLIDYAHTPDALENVIKTVKECSCGRVVVLFGCGGDRDRTKRPKMGAIVSELADFSIVTSDNPRTENPSVIIDDILGGMSSNNRVVIENRREAIKYAIDNAKENDVIILAGKGHETYQEINGIKYHFDEREIVAECLN